MDSAPPKDPSSKQTQFASFEEFWPFYVGEHRHKTTRTLHFIGTSAAMACIVAGTVLRKRWLYAVAPIVGYGPAWAAHFFIEKNRPATWSHPLWSLRADMVMWTKIATGTMDAEVERICGTRARVATPDARSPAQDHVESANVADKAKAPEVTVQV